MTQRSPAAVVQPHEAHESREAQAADGRSAADRAAFAAASYVAPLSTIARRDLRTRMAANRGW